MNCILFANRKFTSFFPIVRFHFCLDNADRFSFYPVPEINHITGNTINNKQSENDLWWIKRDRDKNENDQYHGNKWHRLSNVHDLETVEWNVRYHRQPGIKRQYPGCPVKITSRKSHIVHQPDKSGYQRSGGRTGQSLKIPLVDNRDIRIESCQSQRGTGTKDKSGNPSDTPHSLKRPFINDESRGRMPPYRPDCRAGRRIRFVFW